MNKLRFIENTEKMEFEIDTVFKSNYFFGNVNISTTELMPFEFPRYLQGEDFYIEKLTMNKYTNEATWNNIFQINNTYRKNGYFEKYPFPTPLELGFYRIKTLNHITYNLLDAKITSEIDHKYYLVNNLGERLVNNENEPLIQPI